VPRDLVHAALGGVIGALVAMAVLIVALVFVIDPGSDPVVPEPTTTTPTFGTTIELPDVCEQLPTRC
jgi:hypothetical protein